jgi:hypothetical protein
MTAAQAVFTVPGELLELLPELTLSELAVSVPVAVAPDVEEAAGLVVVAGLGGKAAFSLKTTSLCAAVGFTARTAPL